eukprot:scaffold48331_cov18-Tisochrysis_lutea.AAC.1
MPMLLAMRRHRRQASLRLRRRGRHSKVQQHSRLKEVASGDACVCNGAASSFDTFAHWVRAPFACASGARDSETAEAGGGAGIVVRDIHARF